MAAVPPSVWKCFGVDAPAETNRSLPFRVVGACPKEWACSR
jgi:hypothetical protein